MAVNSYNPRLFSSSSSENDVDEVFRRKGASVVPVGGTLPTAKSRCFSEPVYQNGKEVVKDDSKMAGKGSALSDSSNVLRRQRGRILSQPVVGTENPSDGCAGKNDCSSILQESLSSTTDNVFPEPERIREATKDAYRFSILLEEEETMDEMIPNIGHGQEFVNAEDLEFPDDVDNDEIRMGMGASENEVYYMRDVPFGANEDLGVHTEDQPVFEDDNDDSYPEKEFIPSGYVSCTTQDLPYVSYPWDSARTVLRSYSNSPLVPDIPDDLIKDSGIYPGDIENDFENIISPALIPDSFTRPDFDLKMKVFFGESS